MNVLHYYDYPANKPDVPGMYIVVFKMLDASGEMQIVHSMWSLTKDGTWFNANHVDLSSMIAYAGPLNKYDEAPVYIEGEKVEIPEEV